MYRLFVAVELPASVKQHLLLLGCGVPGARWLDENQMHLTLRFIGEVDGGTMTDITSALAEIEAEPFDVTLCGAGHFPPRGVPQTLWVGVEHNPSLLALRNRIETALSRAGIERDHRKYFPHVALARLKGANTSRVAQFLTQHTMFSTEPFAVDAYCLYSSVLRAEGAIHRIEAGYPLTVRGAFPNEELS